ncbi:MAG: hypothetical protein M3Q08_02780 [Pseudomonadota bacterium]|nr:hypothetical protein [Pseudomonadota bacterium]
MVKLVVMKKGGEPGKIAINPAQVTHVRSSSGPFTDVFFGDHRIAVEGTFDQVVDALSGRELLPEQPAVRNWISGR